MATKTIRRMLAGGAVIAVAVSSMALAEDDADVDDDATVEEVDDRSRAATAAGHDTSTEDGATAGAVDVTGEIEAQSQHVPATDVEAAEHGMCVSEVAPADAPEGGDNPAETCADLQQGTPESEPSDAEATTEDDSAAEEDADGGSGAGANGQEIADEHRPDRTGGDQGDGDSGDGSDG